MIEPLTLLTFVPAALALNLTPAAGSILGQFLILGAVLGAGVFFINSAVGVFAGGLGRRMTAAQRLARGLDYATAAIFTGLALRLALMQRA